MGWTFYPTSNQSAQYLCTLLYEIKGRIEDIYTNHNLNKDSWKTTSTWSAWESELNNNTVAPIYAEQIIDIYHALYYFNNTFVYTTPIIKIPSLTWVNNSRTTNQTYPFYVVQESNINNCTKITASIFNDIMCKVEIIEQLS